jgi:hypothetical protein
MFLPLSLSLSLSLLLSLLLSSSALLCGPQMHSKLRPKFKVGFSVTFENF